MILQPINDIAEICARHGITEAILCPGSRSAPLTLAFVRHPEINTRTISDERSAAFIALGIAQQIRKPVALVCTSGTAAYNFAPAVAEAFYQHIPLLVLTADRPPEWINQQDSQAIMQPKLYGPHVKFSTSLPVDFSHPDAVWHSQRLVNEAIAEATSFPNGPVHINVPLREPFYPVEGEEFGYTKDLRILKRFAPEQGLSRPQLKELKDIAAQCPKIMVLAGLHAPDFTLANAVRNALGQTPLLFLPDLTSNLAWLNGSANLTEGEISSAGKTNPETLRPDLLITFGGPVLSKSLKQFLRKNKPKYHWHLQPAGLSPDTFQSLTHVLPLTATAFFERFWEVIFAGHETDQGYASFWQNRSRNTALKTAELLHAAPFTEFTAARQVLDELPEHSILQLGNSMPIRYAAILGVKPGVEIYANRGTSGIDGSLSTAVGCALATRKIVTVILGDLSFFYDRNALWHNYLPQNMRIVLLNNHGGGIFDIIEGPAAQSEAAEYFITRQRLTAQKAAEEAGLAYFCATDQESLLAGITQLRSSQGPFLLEIETDLATNTSVFKQFQQLSRHEPNSMDPS